MRLVNNRIKEVGMDLKCTTSNCEYHFKNRCTAGCMKVNEKGVCQTKKKRAGGAYAQAIAEFELADELSPLLDNETELKCSCNECAYNDNDTCKSNSVLIGDGIVSTKCFTRRKN